MNIIDNFLNNITMYRLVLYYLIVLLVFAFIYSVFGLMPFSPIPLIFTTTFIVVISYITNEIFRRVFKIPANLESIFITALILSLIITPVGDLSGIPFLFWVGVLSSASKFILAIGRKHIFNPAAFAVFLTALTINAGASWWVGTFYMVIPTVLGGLLIVRKIRRWTMVLSFLVVSIFTIGFSSFLNGFFSADLIKKIFTDSPILFFAFVMLTEPSTAPYTQKFRILYGSLVGFLFSPQIHLGPLYTTPESALVLGNIFSYIVSPKVKLLLRFQEKLKLSPNIYDFIFALEKPFNFTPGQYMEWTLNLKKGDSRGNRRYFTICSSPTEDNIRIGIRFSENGSAFKKQLLEMQQGDTILAGSLSGDFTLPKDPGKKLVFIAGGIGVTPFRSIIKYLADKKEVRVITLFYLVKTETDAVYMDILNQVYATPDIKSIVNVSDKTGVITGGMITKQVPDYKERFFYLSGPHGMVDAFKNTLSDIGVSSNQIKTDYFPGYV